MGNGGLRSVEKVDPADKKQTLTYLRLAELKFGYLPNFGEVLMKGDIMRIIRGE
jgi:GxxExxY protein